MFIFWKNLWWAGGVQKVMAHSRLRTIASDESRKWREIVKRKSLTESRYSPASSGRAWDQKTSRGRVNSGRTHLRTKEEVKGRGAEKDIPK